LVRLVFQQARPDILSRDKFLLFWNPHFSIEQARKLPKGIGHGLGQLQVKQEPNVFTLKVRSCWRQRREE